MNVDPKFWPLWFGGEVSDGTAETVFGVLEDQLRRRFGATLLLTPGRTGLYSWRRLQERRNGEVGGEWPVLPLDLQHLIRSTTGQGRFEVAAQEDTIPNLHCMDMNLCYVGCVINLQSAREWRHDQADEFLGFTPAWYRVRFGPPAGWAHIGLLPVWTQQGWEWPATSRWTDEWETWAGQPEVRLAIEQGWHVKVLERIYAVKTGNSYMRPLSYWAEKWLELREALLGSEELTGAYRTAVRNIILHGIGSFARGPRREVRKLEKGETLPEHELARATVRPEGEDWEYEDYAAGPRDDERYSHPEWAALIWSDCRARLLLNRSRNEPNTGALMLPRKQIVAFAQDAIYTTQDPGWSPCKVAGKFRVKGCWPGPMLAPKTMADLYKITRLGSRG